MCHTAFEGTMYSVQEQIKSQLTSKTLHFFFWMPNPKISWTAWRLKYFGENPIYCNRHKPSLNELFKKGGVIFRKNILQMIQGKIIIKAVLGSLKMLCFLYFTSFISAIWMVLGMCIVQRSSCSHFKTR